VLYLYYIHVTYYIVYGRVGMWFRCLGTMAYVDASHFVYVFIYMYCLFERNTTSFQTLLIVRSTTWPRCIQISVYVCVVFFPIFLNETRIEFRLIFSSEKLNSRVFIAKSTRYVIRLQWAVANLRFFDVKRDVWGKS